MRKDNGNKRSYVKQRERQLKLLRKRLEKSNKIESNQQLNESNTKLNDSIPMKNDTKHGSPP
jgi:hypothetical protein